MIYRSPLSLVACGPVLLEQSLNLVKHRLFGGVVGSSEALGALEHQVLEIVGKTGSLTGVILASDLDSYVGLDSGGLLVYGHIYFQPVVKGVDFGVLRIPLHSLVFVGGAGKCQGRKQHRGSQFKGLFHKHYNTNRP